MQEKPADGPFGFHSNRLLLGGMTIILATERHLVLSKSNFAPRSNTCQTNTLFNLRYLSRSVPER